MWEGKEGLCRFGQFSVTVMGNYDESDSSV